MSSSAQVAQSKVRVTVIHGPGLQFDRDRLRRRLRDLGASRDPVLDVDHVNCADRGAFLDAVADARRSGAASVLSPGSLAGDLEIATAAVELAKRNAVVWLEMTSDFAAEHDGLGPIRIHGRGIEGFAYALASISAQMAWPRQVIRYGAGRDQFATLRLPRSPHNGAVVALLHGGGWRDMWALDRTEGLAVDLARRGYITWNMEFSRIGRHTKGWTATFNDLAAGLDKIGELQSYCSPNLERVVVVGHSSGGHLALWAAARERLEAGLPGAGPRIKPALVVSLAGLADLAEFERRGLDFGSASQLLGGSPAEFPQRYRNASPCHLVPTGVPQLLVHGAQDTSQDLNDLAHLYRDTARAAGDDVDLVEPAATGHADLVDPRSPAWQWVAAEIERRVPAAA